MTADIPVNLEGFSSRSISLRPRKFFSFAPCVLLNGRPVSRTGYGYLIPDDAGKNVEFRLAPRFYDPVPNLIVGGRRIVLLSPIKTYEHVWICLPFLIIAFYGALLGGVCGLFALHTNYWLFRRVHSQPKKYALSGIITLSAWLLYFAIVFVLARWLAIGRKM
jgi:hypothetical protein